YSITSSDAYAKAKAGDDEWLLRLLEIDLRVLADEELVVRVDRLRRKSPKEFAATIGKAIAKGAPPVNKGETETAMWVLAQLTCEQNPEELGKLSSPDGQRLFDAIEGMRTGKAGTRDQSLPPTDAGFRQKLRRQKGGKK